MSVSEGPSLDAKHLLDTDISTYWVEFPIENDYAQLWDVVDSYLQYIAHDKIKRDLILSSSSLVQYEHILKTLKRRVLDTPWFKLSEITTASVDRDGFLRLKYQSGREQSFNLVSNWNDILYPHPALTPIQEEARKKTEALREEANRETYFGGSVIVEYAPGVAYQTAAGIALIQSGIMLGRGTSSLVTTIRSLSVRDEFGKLQKIDLKEVYAGVKEVLGTNILRILEQHGFLLDPETNRVFDPVAKTVIESTQKIKGMTYEQWRQIPGNANIPKAQFDQYKSEIIHGERAMTDLLRANSVSGKSILSRLGGMLSRNAMHLFFMPIFFRHFTTHSNSVTLLASLGEMGAFTYGAKLGGKLADGLSPVTPWILKPVSKLVSPIVTWGLAVILGKELTQEYLDTNRAKWRYFFQDGFGSQFKNGKSALGHLIGFGVADTLHHFNKFARWQNNEEEWDIGIPRIETPLTNGNYIGTLPEQTLFQDKINFGTDPWEWMRWAIGRDSDTWNDYVEYYRPRIKDKIYDLLEKYNQNRSMFSDAADLAEVWGKDNMLAKHLDAILKWGSEGAAFTRERDQLITSIVAMAKRWAPKREMDQVIDNRISQLRVDPLFIKMRWDALKTGRKAVIESMVEQLPVDERKKSYVKSILPRMIANEAIVAPATYIQSTTGFNRKSVRSEENIIFQGLLDSNVTFVIIDANSKATTYKVGDYFALILDTMLDYKREHEFVTELAKGNKKWYQWTL